MDIPQRLISHLDELTDALEIPGADLQAMLSVLIDDLTSAVPSFLGLTVIIGSSSGPVTIASTDLSHVRPVGSSLQLPLHLMAEVERGSVVVFYAAQPGAFADLAAATRRAFDLDGQVVIDQHLTGVDPDEKPWAFDEASVINRAIGVLIGRGQPPNEAHLTLARLAADQGITRAAAARGLLGCR